MKRIIEGKKVELAYRNLDKINIMTDEELLETINEIYGELTKENVKEADEIINYFHKCVVRLYENENITGEKIEDIISCTKKTYGIIINNYLSEYDEMALVHIGLVISRLRDRYNKKEKVDGASNNNI